MSEQRIHVVAEGVTASYINEISPRRPAHRPVVAAAPVRRRPLPARRRPVRRPVTVAA
jgi:hypothetical protein